MHSCQPTAEVEVGECPLLLLLAVSLGLPPGGHMGSNQGQWHIGRAWLADNTLNHTAAPAHPSAFKRALDLALRFPINLTSVDNLTSNCQTWNYVLLQLTAMSLLDV